MLWWFLALIVVVFVYITVRKKQNYWKERHVPHDKPIFLLGNIAYFLFRQQSNTDWILESYRKFKSRYFGWYQFMSPNLMIRDPEIIKQIGVRDFDSFMNHTSVVSNELDPIFGRSLFALKGNEWREMRANLSPAFTGSKMRAMFNLMVECAEQFTKYHENTLEPGKAHPKEMKELFTRFANDVIATTAFGIKCDSLNEPKNEFFVNGQEMTDFGGFQTLKVMFYLFSPKLSQFFNIRLFSEKLCNFFQNLVIGTIKYREKEGIHRPDMIQLLIEAKNGKLKYEDDKHDNSGFATVEESHVGKDIKQRKQEWTDMELTAQATIFFIAGFDTVSTVLSFLAYELALNPDVQRKLQDEIDKAKEDTNGKITYEKITKMSYLDCVICEALRKWPAVDAIDRECTKSFTIHAQEPHEKNLHIEKGVVVWIPVYGIHRDPEYYPDPERFDPERFNDENKKKIVPFTYLPFGIGPRNCIGSRFALLEIKSLVFHLLSSFDIVRNEKTQIPFKFSKNTISVAAENGFWVSFRKRTSAL